MFLFVRFDTFAVGCIATERTGKRVEENANVSFLNHSLTGNHASTGLQLVTY